MSRQKLQLSSLSGLAGAESAANSKTLKPWLRLSSGPGSSSELTADPLGNMSFDRSLAVLEQEGLYLASKKASIKVEKVYQEDIQHRLEEQPFALFCSSQRKALASAAGNFIAKRRRYRKQHASYQLCQKHLKTTSKKDTPPSMLRVQNIHLEGVKPDQ